MKEAKDLYERGVNIMRLFRETESSEINSLYGILAAYDLQSGSYVRLLSDPVHAQFAQAYCAAVANILDRLSPISVMEAGVGEATTLVNTLHHMHHRPLHALGLIFRGLALQSDATSRKRITQTRDCFSEIWSTYQSQTIRLTLSTPRTA